MPKESVIKHYSSSTTGNVPSSGDLVEGELAINTADEKVFFKNLAGNVVSLGASKDISGAYAAKALPNTFTGLQTFSVGITSLGATFANDITVSSDIRIGKGNGGSNNLVVGTNSGAAFTSGGNENVGIGILALTANSSGYYNTAIGFKALSSITGNFRCTAIGWNSLARNTGDRNTAVGSNALGFNSTGTFNVAVGNNALGSCDTGGGNMAMGNAALNSLVSANDNTAVGTGALFAINANSNIGIGANAGRWLSDGSTTLTGASNSIYIGAATKALSNTETNVIVIGANNISDGSNTTIIGTSSTTSTRVFGLLSTNGGISAAGATFSGNISAPNIVNSLNGLTGARTLTGDGGALAGVGNDTIRARLASTSLTGVASFNSSRFAVNSAGQVDSLGVYSVAVGGATLTGSVSLTSGTNITLTPSGSTITIASSGGGGGVTTTAANTWTALQTFSVGISGSGATFSGHISAATKSFVIPHPTVQGMTLRHGSLEGPENGVYVRGRAHGHTITLPHYWTGLVDEETITVQLTPFGKPQSLWVESVDIGSIGVSGCDDPSYFYTVYGERKDVARLKVEE